MKRVVLVSLLSCIILLIAGCDVKEHGEDTSYKILQEYFEDNGQENCEEDSVREEVEFVPDENEIIDTNEFEGEYITIEDLSREYDPLEIMILGWGSFGDFMECADIPNMYLIVEELVAQGHSDSIRYLIQIADDIGYSRSAILGNYYGDGNHRIHRVNGPCLDTADLEHFYPLGPYNSKEDLEEDFSDWIFCEDCFQ